MIETKRLILRPWEPEDGEAYFHLNQDPKVLEFLKGPLTLEQVHHFITAANLHQQQYGYALWAAELKATRTCMGFIGLQSVPFQAAFTPAVEVGWRLGSPYWGKGYATEGATAALHYGWQQAGLQEIVAFTVPANHRSLRVMEKIGLQRDWTGDFAHPLLPSDHRLSHHVLYRGKQALPLQVPPSSTRGRG